MSADLDVGPPGASLARLGEAEIGPGVPQAAQAAAPEELAAALEAICFALNRPLTLEEAAAILGRGAADLGETAETLAIRLRGGGLMLQRHGEELQLVTRPEVAWAVQRALNPERPGRLSRAAMETLAIVAYRQPVTRSALEAIRGVNCDAVLDSLERRDLIAEVGRQETPGHPRLFGTTLRFLQTVGLERVADLPAFPEGAMPPALPGEEESVNTAPPSTDPSDAESMGAGHPATPSAGVGIDPPRLQ